MTRSLEQLDAIAYDPLQTHLASALEELEDLEDELFGLFERPRLELHADVAESVTGALQLVVDLLTVASHTRTDAVHRGKNPTRPLQQQRAVAHREADDRE